MGVLGPAPRRDHRAGPDAAAALQRRRQRLQHPRQDRSRDDRPGRAPGSSKAVGDAKDKDFWGVDPDIESISRLHPPVRDATNGRWNSPKYLLGRELRDHARARASSTTSRARTWPSTASCSCPSPSTSRPSSTTRATTAPSPSSFDYAAVAWYHKVLPSRPQKLEAFLTRCGVRGSASTRARCSTGDALPASAQGGRVQKLHEYTGLSDDYIEKANLRVSEGRYSQELLRQKGITVGSARRPVHGPDPRPARPRKRTTIRRRRHQRGLHRGLPRVLQRRAQVRPGQDVHDDQRRRRPRWDFKHKTPRLEFAAADIDAGPDLAHAMILNPHLRVLVQNGHVRSRDAHLRDGDPDERRAPLDRTCAITSR